MLTIQLLGVIKVSATHLVLVTCRLSYSLLCVVPVPSEQSRNDYGTRGIFLSISFLSHSHSSRVFSC